MPALAAGFIEIELDVETGKFEILDYVGVADCGTVMHPLGLRTQIKSGAVMGFGLAALERHIYDPQNGLPGNVGLLSGEARVLSRRARTMHDGMRSTSPIRRTRVGTKGIGEPVHGLRVRRRCSARSPTRSAATISTACRSCAT